MDQAAFVVLILFGVLALVGALAHARTNWRPDIPPYGRGTRFLDVTIHPERYALGHAVPLIRRLRWCGAVSLAGAMATLAYRAFADFISVGAR